LTSFWPDISCIEATSSLNFSSSSVLIQGIPEVIASAPINFFHFSQFISILEENLLYLVGHFASERLLKAKT
jgi:hypothetical protein